MSGKTAGRALKAAISEGLLGSPSLFYEPGSPKHAALFYDLDEFEAGLDRAKDAFGKGINCDRGLENALSSLRSWFFTIRTDPRPVNNVLGVSKTWSRGRDRGRGLYLKEKNVFRRRQFQSCEGAKTLYLSVVHSKRTASYTG